MDRAREDAEWEHFLERAMEVLQEEGVEDPSQEEIEDRARKIERDLEMDFDEPDDDMHVA